MTAQDRGWGAPCSGQIVTVALKDGVRLPVRKEVAVLVGIMANQTQKLGYDLKPGWCWGYACRKIRGSTNWSNHAWGLAVDLNAPENPMGPRTGKIRQHPKVIALWKEYGFRWGGDYSGRADDMHFEFLGTPTDAQRLTERAKTAFGTGENEDMTPEQAQQLKDLAEAVGKPYADGLTVLKILTEKDGENFVDGIKLILQRLDAIEAKLRP